MKKLLIFFFIIFLKISWVTAQISFHTIPQKIEVGLNEPIHVQFILSIKNKVISDIGNINLPTFTNSQVVGRQIIQNQSYDEDGTIVIEYGVEVILRAIKTGNIRIAEATVTVDGKKYSTKPLTISVVGNTNNSDENSALTPRMGEIFLALKISEKNPYQNEEVVAQLKFYTRRLELLNSITNLIPPNFQGLFVQPVKERTNTYKQEIINGDPYFSRVISSYVMFPSKSGTIIINPFTLTLTIPDGFFDEHEINIKSAPITLQVKKLPENSPIDFYGVVGEYKMKAFSNKKKVKTDEAITMHVEITGKGNISLIKLPEFAVSEGIEQYKPKSKLESEATLKGVIGKLSISTVLVPQKKGNYNVKVKTVSYFDPKEGIYKQLSVPPITFEALDKPKEETEENSALKTIKDSSEIRSFAPNFQVEKVISEVFEGKPERSKLPWIILLASICIITTTIFCFLYMKKKKSKQKETNDQEISMSEEKVKSIPPFTLSNKTEPKNFVLDLVQLKKIAEKGEDKKEFYALLETILHEVADQNIKKGVFITLIEEKEMLAKKYGNEIAEEWKNMILKSQIERYSNLLTQESLLLVYLKAEELINKLS